MARAGASEIRWYNRRLFSEVSQLIITVIQRFYKLYPLKKISIEENGEATVISYTSETLPVMRFLLELTQPGSRSRTCRDQKFQPVLGPDDLPARARISLQPRVRDPGFPRS
jgi:hypothetical protein